MPKKTNPKCLHCKKIFGSNYQLIFDETGRELDLQKLLNDCFKISIEEDKTIVQGLCSKCVNKLIEIFDVIEKNRERQEDTEESEDLLTEYHGIQTEDKSDSQLGCSEDQLEDTEDDIEDINIKIEITHSQLYKNYDQNERIDEELVDEDIQTTFKELIENNSNHSGDEFFQLSRASDNDEATENQDLKESDADYLEEADEVNLRNYKENIFKTDITSIHLNETVTCQYCSQEIKGHSNILQHIQENHAINDASSLEELSYPCIVDDECSLFETLSEVAYHLIFKHYDLANIQIYITCPECEKTFKNFTHFNKHSCCTAKNLSRLAKTCEHCEKQFNSNKRYRFHQQFHLEKRRPKACMLCDKIFRYEDEFFEHIMYAHENKEDLKFWCQACDLKYTAIKNLNHHEQLHTIERQHLCSFCDKAFIYNQMLQDHIRANHSGRELKCEVCNKTFAKKGNLTKHMYLHASKPIEKTVSSCNLCGFVGSSSKNVQAHISKYHAKNPNIKVNEELLLLAYTCEHCELPFNTIEHLNSHRQIHKADEFKCDMCPLSYPEFKKLKTHKLTHAAEDRKPFPLTRHYVCNFERCEASYELWTGLSKHKASIHVNNKNLLACTKCNEIFPNKTKLNAHLARVHEESKLHCTYCSKVFANQMALSVHMSRKHNQSQFKCEICDYCYKSQEVLDQHNIHIHIATKCEICGKHIRNQKNLNLHMNMVHNKIKRHFCSVCNKGFYHKSDCTEHEEAVHNKKTRYNCDKCAYATFYAESLKVHSMQHDKSKAQFTCEVCNKQFMRKAALDVHFKVHYIPKSFKCPHEGCEISFPLKNLVRKHITDNHTDPPAESAPKPKRTRKVATSKRPTVVSDVFVDDDDGLEEYKDAEIFEENVQHIDDIEIISVNEEFSNNFNDDTNSDVIVWQRDEPNPIYMIQDEDGSEFDNVQIEYIIAKEIETGD